MRWLPRTRIFETNPLLWKWHTEVAPSGFWVKTRGPFMWWGKSPRSLEQRSALIATLREEDHELLERLSQT